MNTTLAQAALNAGMGISPNGAPLLMNQSTDQIPPRLAPTRERKSQPGRLILLIGIVATAAASWSATADARQIVRPQQSLKSTICHTRVVADAVFSDLRRARIQSLINWKRKVSIRHSGRFAYWGKARSRRIRESYDRIEQNWKVTRIASPCGPRSLTKR